MLEKFLPFPKHAEDSEKKPKSGAEEITDDSLFFNPSSLREEVATADFVIKFASGTIIFFSALLIVVLILHNSINFMLNQLLNEQRNLEYKMSSYAGLEERATRLAKRIEYSKRAVGTRKPLTTRVSFIMTRIPQDISPVISSFTPDTFELAVKGQSPVSITRMFLKWLQDGGVSEVAIKEAVYSSDEDVYLVKLSGVYR